MSQEIIAAVKKAREDFPKMSWKETTDLLNQQGVKTESGIQWKSNNLYAYYNAKVAQKKRPSKKKVAKAKAKKATKGAVPSYVLPKGTHTISNVTFFKTSSDPTKEFLMAVFNGPFSDSKKLSLIKEGILS